MVPFSALLPIFGLFTIWVCKLIDLLHLGDMAYCASVMFGAFLAHVLPIYGLVTILVGGLLYFSYLSFRFGCFLCTLA